MGAEGYFLVGPTASGKSAVAHCIAEHHGHFIVSADSMNLYRGMTIGTAKPSDAERAAVDYGGIDLVDPTEKFSVADYLRHVKPLFVAGREILVVGGTGLYIKCLTEGFDEVPPENPSLRRALEALPLNILNKRAQTEASSLYQTLTADDRQNPRRLIRLLERAGADSGTPRKWNAMPKPKLVGLQVERGVLHQRIEKRVHAMYAAGLLAEAEVLLQLELSATAVQAIGYAEAFAVLRGTMSEAEAIEKTVIRTRQLAKRQMTWFRNQLNVEWINVDETGGIADVADAVLAAWKINGNSRVWF